jgi:hypothetical protein
MIYVSKVLNYTYNCSFLFFFFFSFILHKQFMQLLFSFNGQINHYFLKTAYILQF